MPRPGTIACGEWHWPPISGPAAGQGFALITYKSSAKVDEKESDGQDDGRTTFKGKKPASGTIEIHFVDDPRYPEIHAAAMELIRAWSPRGPNAGKPWELSAPRASAHYISAIVFKDLDGPNDEPGSNKLVAKFAWSSWVKPTAKGRGKGATPATPYKWHPEPKGAAPAPPATGFGSGSTTKPKAKP
jgi:hypothetical protein